MSINVTRWTLMVALIGMVVGGVAVQVLMPLNGAEAGVDDTMIGGAMGALLTVVGHYFPRG